MDWGLRSAYYQPQEYKFCLYLWLSWKNDSFVYKVAFVDWLVESFIKNQEILWILKNPSHGSIDSHSSSNKLNEAESLTCRNFLQMDLDRSSIYSCSHSPAQAFIPSTALPSNNKGLHLLFIWIVQATVGSGYFEFLGSFFHNFPLDCSIFVIQLLFNLCEQIPSLHLEKIFAIN